MPEPKNPFVAWEDRVICHERGKRVIHYYLKDALGELVLAVVGTEPSARHMLYTVQEKFLHTYGRDILINGCTKWRSRREVFEWFTGLIQPQNQPLDCLNSQINESVQALVSLKLSASGSSFYQTHLPDKMVSKKWQGQNIDIMWTGPAWISDKQLGHYPGFSRNGVTIAVHSFVSIMAEDESHYLGYIEDLYENKKGRKKVKVRWFHRKEELKDAFSSLNPLPGEVFITPHVQVINPECIDGIASVLTPKHYEKCLAIWPQTSTEIYMCFRQLGNNEVKPFTLYRLRGYSNQTILSRLNNAIVSKRNFEKEGEELSRQDLSLPKAKRSRNRKEHRKLEVSGISKSTLGNQIPRSKPPYPKLKFKLSRTATGLNVVRPKIQFPQSLEVNDKIEFLCQDSGIRGCWFRCKVLKNTMKKLKIQYENLKDVDESCNIEEWVPASRVAAPDKLGMRCSKRLTIRPLPPPDACKSSIFTVGAPVDAWWSDGWWEGIVTGINISGNDTFQVYLPGENMSRTFQKTEIRTSRDWVDDKWVDIQAKPDILTFI